MRRVLAFLVVWVGWAAPSPAQSWVDAVFPEHSYDFGTVARGSKVKHAFKLVNTTNATLHIASWKTKCGCTDVRVGAREIPPGTQTFVEATIDTTRFQGFKPSGLTLVFDQPQYAEKDLNVTCFIRGDVLLSPGVVDFGPVNRAAGATESLQLSYFGGQTNWGIVKLQTISDHLTARLEEIAGTRSQGSVQYRLSATLKPGAPIGYFKDEITLVTNDPTIPTVPVFVTGQVQGNVVLTPSSGILTLGAVKAGQSVSQSVLIRSAQPFLISDVKPDSDALSATKGAEKPRPIHKLTVTLKAPAQPGPYHGEIAIQTSLNDEPPALLSIFATVVP